MFTLSKQIYEHRCCPELRVTVCSCWQTSKSKQDHHCNIKNEMFWS